MGFLFLGRRNGPTHQVCSTILWVSPGCGSYRLSRTESGIRHSFASLLRDARPRWVWHAALGPGGMSGRAGRTSRRTKHTAQHEMGKRTRRSQNTQSRQSGHTLLRAHPPGSEPRLLRSSPWLIANSQAGNYTTAIPRKWIVLWRPAEQGYSIDATKTARRPFQ